MGQGIVVCHCQPHRRALRFHRRAAGTRGASRSGATRCGNPTFTPSIGALITLGLVPVLYAVAVRD
jgi:hypothetical protein